MYFKCVPCIAYICAHTHTYMLFSLHFCLLTKIQDEHYGSVLNSGDWFSIYLNGKYLTQTSFLYHSSIMNFHRFGNPFFEELELGLIAL